MTSTREILVQLAEEAGACTIPNGGPAFPTQEQRFPDGVLNKEAEYGMTLRDYFAAKAMQGFCVAFTDWSHIDIARAAYNQADAMLVEQQGEVK